MYGLTHRLPNISDTEPVAPAAAHPPRALGSVLVIDRDPLTLQLVRQAVCADHHVVIARDAAEAMSLMDLTQPDVIVLDSGLDEAEVALVTVGPAATDSMDAIPTVMIDLDEPINAQGIRARIDAARKVTRRVYLGGGLRHRMAA
jgi:PleD family two-component response regulator